MQIIFPVAVKCKSLPWELIRPAIRCTAFATYLNTTVPASSLRPKKSLSTSKCYYLAFGSKKPVLAISLWADPHPGRTQPVTNNCQKPYSWDCVKLTLKHHPTTHQRLKLYWWRCHGEYYTFVASQINAGAAYGSFFYFNLPYKISLLIWVYTFWCWIKL